jgi:hypothetical protein
MKNDKIKKHRISGGFNPKDYSYCESFDNRLNECYDHASGEYCGEANDPLDIFWIEKIQENGYDCNHCTHCGSALSSGVVYLHKPSGEHIIMGNTCRDRLEFESASAIQKAHLENRLRLARLRMLMKHNWRWKIVGEFLIENEEKHHIVKDMLNKLNKNFKLSRRQIAFARKLVRDEDERETRQAEREARIANTPDWENGRYEIEGKVLSCKWKDSDFGGSYKLLIELTDGRRCWGSAPQKLFDETEDVKGLTIKIKARFQASSDDTKFAFFSRPTYLPAA